MKYPEIKVSIPEPCHEDWNNMTPTEKGKFCGVCTKEVIDFSAKSDEEIVKYAVANTNLCGRFHASQLDRKLIVDRKKRNHWLSYAASLLFPMALFSQEVKKGNQNIPKTEQTNTSTFTSLNISSLQRQGKTVNQISTVNGTVTDDSGLPLQGASIVIKGTDIGKTTDFDGNFSIKANLGQILVISYEGFESKEIKVHVNKYTYNIILLSDGSLSEVIVLGGAVGVAVSCYSEDYYKKPMSKEEIKEKEERTKNYFEFQKKKWREKRERKRAERAKRKAKKAQKQNLENN
ncbi:carboxypeptidase-like regulatory domain-containing protein [Kordia sp. YSTF-M3]|uniref:Carboxypeptidase-like regulatory domain-containing protein n=1 Tax=Kordia aestuariivivens TaxID=2759037 RepID=A0ABR7QD17_9FLAO|nr:carboxypeptidase-like regulatory domain-containing protein [Kordia aestuariivivens]MBC8756229.1 carboxypeptidase-like regulatory domain-containing protein [Kordia aestuariivivens]